MMGDHQVLSIIFFIPILQTARRSVRLTLVEKAWCIEVRSCTDKVPTVH